MEKIEKFNFYPYLPVTLTFFPHVIVYVILLTWITSPTSLAFDCLIIVFFWTICIFFPIRQIVSAYINTWCRLFSSRSFPFSSRVLMKFSSIKLKSSGNTALPHLCPLLISIKSDSIPSVFTQLLDPSLHIFIKCTSVLGIPKPTMIDHSDSSNTVTSFNEIYVNLMYIFHNVPFLFQ